MDLVCRLMAAPAETQRIVCPPIPNPLHPAPLHRHLRLRYLGVLLLPLPLTPLISALEAPPHVPSWKLCLQFSLFPERMTQAHPNQPLTFPLCKHSLPPAPSLIGCLLPTSNPDPPVLRTLSYSSAPFQ